MGLNTAITQAGQLTDADTLTFYASGVPSQIFLSNDEFAPGWLDAGGTDFSNTLLPEGSAFLLKNTKPNVGNGAFNVTFPAQTIAP